MNRRSEKREQILLAALDCFSAKGVANTTISDIRQRAGISVGSLYHHFESKEAIAGALYIWGMQDHFERLRQALEKAQAPKEGISLIVTTYCDWITQHPAWAKFIFFSKEEALRPEDRRALIEQSKGYFFHIKRWLTPHCESGEIQVLPIDLYHSLIIGPAQDYARHWLAGRVKVPLKVHRELFAEAAWRALAARVDQWAPSK